MKKYICIVCGYSIKLDLEGYKCPICKGNLILEEQMKKMEEISQLTDECISDTVLILGLNISISKEGNDKIYLKIENLEDVQLRIQFRRCFIKAGGEIPQR